MTSRASEGAITLLALQPLQAMRVAELPLHHRDPFDRMLIAQAQAEGVPLITADKVLAKYDVAIIRA